MKPYWGDGNEIHPPASRVNTELVSLDGEIKVIVTKWQWWKLTFEGITTDTNNFDIGYQGKKYFKSGYKRI